MTAEEQVPGDKRIVRIRVAIIERHGALSFGAENCAILNEVVAPSKQATTELRSGKFHVSAGKTRVQFDCAA